MIWNSIFLMTLIDVIIILASLLTLGIFHYYLDMIKTLKLTMGISPILLALMLNALFHGYDLLVMHRILFIPPDGNSMAIITDLHLNWSWLKTLISVGSIAIGISYLVRVLIPKTINTLETLQLTEKALRESNDKLEEQIDARLTELQSINAQLQNEINERKIVEEKLTNSRSRWQSLLKNVPNILFEFDRDGIILFINFVTVDAEVDDVIGTSLYNFTLPEDHQRVKGYIDKVFETGEPLSYETIGFDEVWYSVRIGAIKRSGQTTSLMMILTDITELKNSELALRESEGRLLQAMKIARLGIWDWNLTTGDTRWYGEMFNIYGISPETFTGNGKDYVDFVRDDYQERYNSIQEAFGKGITETQLQAGVDLEYNPQELCIVRPDGTEAYTMGDAITIVDDDGNPLRMIGVTLDITERKQAEFKLNQSEEIIALKDHIVSTVSHEFRTPLAVIQTSIDLLTRYGDKLSSQRKEELFEQIHEQVTLLDELIGDILSINRAQSKQIEFNPGMINVEAFCHTIFDQIQFLDSSSHQFEFISQLSGKQAMLDGKLLEHALKNLLTNAVKYSLPDSPITLELEHDDTTICIKVIDRGIGIPEESLDQLFEPFFRAGNTTGIAGTGMGLAIVKEYIELHGGTIAVESKIDEGSTFTIIIPVRDTP